MFIFIISKFPAPPSSPTFFGGFSQKNLKRFLVRKNYWVEQPGSFSNDMNEMIEKKHYWKIPAHFDMTKYIDEVFLRSLISVPYWKFSFWKEKKLQFLIEPPRKFNSNKHWHHLKHFRWTENERDFYLFMYFFYLVSTTRTAVRIRHPALN